MRMTRLLPAAAVLFALSMPGARAVSGDPVPVMVLASKAQPYSEKLVLRGRTEAVRKVEVRSEIAGLVVSPPLRKGIEVKAGDVLCRIADAERKAELAEAKASLEEAELSFKASERLSKKGYTSEISANAMVAELEMARFRLVNAELNIDRLEIRAPFDGLLESDTAELGALLQNGSVCASLIALDPIKLIAYAPERSVDELLVGADVSARLANGRVIEGEISFVSRSADRDTRTYLVEAKSPNADHSIRDGMSTEIEVSLKGRNAHFAPQAALTLNDEGELGVRIAIDEIVHFTPVSILKDAPDGVWLDGLPEEAEIIIVGQEFVREGAKVRVSHVDPAKLK